VGSTHLGRHPDIGEGDAARVGGPLAHVDLLAADDHSRAVPLHDEAREGLAGRALGVLAGARQHEVPVGHAAIGDPHLGAVEQPVVAVAARARRDPGHVGAGARLRHAVGAHQRLAVRRLEEAAQVLLLLRVRAVHDHGH